MKFNIKNKIIFISIISVFLAFVSANNNNNNRIDDYVINRPEVGDSPRVEDLEVYDENGGLLARIKALIEPKQLGEEELNTRFAEAYKEIKKDMLLDNIDCNHVSSKLNLVEKSRDGLFQYEWYSDNYEVVNYNGCIHNDDFEENQKESVTLSLIMKYGDIRREYSIEIIVVAPKEGVYSEATKVIEEDIQKALSDNKEKDIQLPETVNGQRVQYAIYQEKNNPVVFIFLGIFAIVLVVYGDKKEKDKIRNKRIMQLKVDYSEVVSKLILLLGAGMTTRMAWQKIAEDYKKKKKAGEKTTRYAYEEIVQTDYNMKSGISEVKAYEMFGKRCDTKEYMKLASLLQTNVRKGTKELRRLLEEEATEAFEQRKSLARIKGEEASTKLLLPMLMMLVVVMGIIMIPAMMKFNI